MRNVPNIRFNTYNKEYEELRLREMMSRVSKNNKDEEFQINDILSLSSTKGIVDRNSLFEDTYSNVNHKNYIKTRLNDLVYGKSISSSYPYGLFKANRLRDGLLSTLYFTFKPNDKIVPAYLDKYFSYQNRANNFLKKYVLVGDRYITADADYILSGKAFIPDINEQKKIVEIFDVLDEKISLLEHKLENLKLFKKGISNRLINRVLMYKKTDDNWTCYTIKDIYLERNERSTGNEELLSVTMNDGVKRRSDISSKDNSSENKSNYKKVYKNDMVYNSMRMWQGANGVSPYNGIVSPAYTVMYSNDEIDHLFMGYLFKNPLLVNKFRKYSQGLTRDTWNLKYPLIKDIKIRLPEFSEQQKISSSISSLDKKIDVLNKEFEILKQFNLLPSLNPKYNVYIIEKEAFSYAK